MVLNTIQALVNFNGKPLQEMVDGKLVDITVRTVTVNVLLSPKEKDKGTDKIRKYDLAMRIYKEDSVQLTLEEATLIKELVGEAFGPIVVGQLYKMLEA
jgi:hypothetical protein